MNRMVLTVSKTVQQLETSLNIRSYSVNEENKMTLKHILQAIERKNQAKELTLQLQSLVSFAICSIDDYSNFSAKQWINYLNLIFEKINELKIRLNEMGEILKDCP